MYACCFQATFVGKQSGGSRRVMAVGGGGGGGGKSRYSTPRQ